MRWGVALTGALLTTLTTPATWPLALATFLLRGGVVLVALPIVALPSPVGLGNLLAPTVIAVVFQGVSVEVAVLVGLVTLALVAWIVVGGLAAATLEAEGARIVARDEVLPATGRAAFDTAAFDTAAFDTDAGVAAGHRRIASRILVARLVGHIPTGLSLAWGAARLLDVAYRELTSPLDVSSPIVLRVLRGAPEAIAVIVVLWMAGEVVGALAARQIALGGAGVAGALRHAAGAAVRRPLTILVEFLVPTAALGLVLLSSALASASAWVLVRAAIRARGDPFGPTLAVVLFVSLWMVGLALIAVTAAWRSAVWSIACRDLWARRAGPAGKAPG